MTYIESALRSLGAPPHHQGGGREGGGVTKAALNCRLMHIHGFKAKRRVSIAEEWRQLFIFKSILAATDRWVEGLGESGTSGAAVKCAGVACSALTRAQRLEGEKKIRTLFGTSA